MGRRIGCVVVMWHGGLCYAVDERRVFPATDHHPPEHCEDFMTQRLQAHHIDLAPAASAFPGDLRQFFDQLHSRGFRGVQLSAADPQSRPRDLSRSAIRDLAATARRREVAIRGLDLWIPPAHFSDPATSQRVVDAFDAAIQCCEAFGRIPLSTRFPGDAGATGDTEDSIDRAVVQAIRDQADRFGVTLADHVVIDQESRSDAIAAATRATDGFGIDCAQWLADGISPVRGIPDFGTRVASVRLVDLLQSGMRGPVGERGDARLDVQALRAVLSLRGTDDALSSVPIVIDARGWTDPWSGVEQSARVFDEAGFEIGGDGG